MLMNSHSVKPIIEAHCTLKSNAQETLWIEREAPVSCDWSKNINGLLMFWMSLIYTVSISVTDCECISRREG